MSGVNCNLSQLDQDTIWIWDIQSERISILPPDYRRLIALSHGVLTLCCSCKVLWLCLKLQNALLFGFRHFLSWINGPTIVNSIVYCRSLCTWYAKLILIDVMMCILTKLTHCSRAINSLLAAHIAVFIPPPAHINVLSSPVTFLPRRQFSM